jgi:hypothetical protein
MLNYEREVPDPPYEFHPHDEYIPDPELPEPALAVEPEWLNQERLTALEWIAVNN